MKNDNLTEQLSGKISASGMLWGFESSGSRLLGLGLLHLMQCCFEDSGRDPDLDEYQT